MQHVGRYEVIDVLGEGGMGQVLRAWDPKLQQHVALKVINPALMGKQKVQVRAARELNVMLSLRSHPNIVTVLDYVEEPFALVMELLEGEELADVIARNPQGMSFDMIYETGMAMVGALGFAHEKQILHRDMKPGNVMVMTFGQKHEIKVLDFGLAGFLASDVKLTRTGARMGTPGYMAPEQHLGATVDGRTDIYAMGVILYEMAVGYSPFKEHTDTDYQLMKAQLELPMPRPSSVRSGIPVALEEIILKATAREPEDRYQNAGEFLEDLKRASSGDRVDYGLRNKPEPSPAPTQPRGAAPPTILESDEPVSPSPGGGSVHARSKSSQAWIWLVVALLLLGGGAAALILTNSKEQDKLDKKAAAQERRADRLRKAERDEARRERELARERADLERQRREGKLSEDELARKEAALKKKQAEQEARDRKSRKDAEAAKAAREEAEAQRRAAEAEAERRRQDPANQIAWSNCKDWVSKLGHVGTSWEVTTYFRKIRGIYTLTPSIAYGQYKASILKDKVVLASGKEGYKERGNSGSGVAQTNGVSCVFQARLGGASGTIRLTFDSCSDGFCSGSWTRTDKGWSGRMSARKN